MIQGESYTVHIGNNLDILPTLPDNSVDSIVTDPPYELGFMGKKWDSSGIAYSVELWRECLRVLKPGGHLLSFGGTRTWHRVAVGIEDAGFEVRDSIAWMYGSGFPKSLDVSKAIDKRNGKPRPTQEFRDFLRAGKAKAGLTSDQIDKSLGFTSAVFSPHYVGDNPQIEYPTKEKYEKLKELLTLDDSFDYLIDWVEAEREVLGQQTQGKLAVAPGQDNDRSQIELDITAPSTPEAEQWQGWGTALKPAFEPIVVARKPLIGTVAENVLTHGTGALNIDGSRIGTEQLTYGGEEKERETSQSIGSFSGEREEKTVQGRWPANVILDEYSAEVLDQQSGLSQGGKLTIGGSPRTNIGHKLSETSADRSNALVNYGDSGGASRFYYVAKASKRDRNEGLEALPAGQPIGGADKWTETDRRRGEGVTREPSPNIHPTVKPTQLMRYLVKLVTPPGGTVLDPFTGSGSTGKAAILEGFRFIGCELTEDYIPIIEGRLKHAESMAAEAETKKDEALF
jgi:DNA modification methylase